MTRPLVGILVGSASDLELAQKATDILLQLEIPFEVGIASAHRTPEDVMGYARKAQSRGLRVLIGIAGLSAALPGVMAAHTLLPVLGVPVSGSGELGGLDALLSITQMPPGVPVGSVGVNGAKNAALLAARIIALENKETRENLGKWVQHQAEQVAKSRKELHPSAAVPEDAF